MNRVKTIAVYGFISWLIPFALSIPLYPPLHETMMPLFKNIMLVTGMLTGVTLLVRYFRGVNADHVREGLVVGLAWLAVNIVLDLATLVAAFKMPVAEYFLYTGIVYLSIPIISTGMGFLLAGRQGVR
ncbi:MAG: hypothetical protein EPN93_04110 [Spirochaetes bacterium]|nr:MAG: hypothetical protein EPN93_04110 [Spirochaetota bacterium]